MALQRYIITILIATSLLISSFQLAQPVDQTVNTNPPKETIKLVFIHHSTGENWLNDDDGGLARALQDNNYFVSDTNYGWGPDSIGDRTDIPNWLEWFRSNSTDSYLEALYDEGEVHSPYNRTLPDPGGENRIVLFKSCFPNSALDGNPNDPPTEGTDFTVGNAKYVYNEILQYFQSRPDKLFVVVTAPPLTDGTYAKNARAFNNWLVNNWLAENNYALPNVAVFDFYNILTAPENHHRVNNGAIEHVIDSSRNTSYYPSGDDHPSQAGNRKATTEFIPMLNAFYNNWIQSGGATTPPIVEPQQEAVEVPPASPGSVSGSVLDDFEAELSPWEAFNDESESSQMLCYHSAENAFNSSQSLQLDFAIPAGSWGTCTQFFEAPMDLSSYEGMLFQLRAAEPGAWMHVDVYAGQEGARETYYYELQIPEGSASDWQEVRIPWSSFLRAGWEENAGQPFSKPDEVSGIAFGFPEIMDGVNEGTVWVDDLQLFTSSVESIPPEEPQQPVEEEPMEEEAAESEEPAESKPGLPFCGSAALIPLSLFAVSFYNHRRRSV
jgi:hypothetical protein